MSIRFAPILILLAFVCPSSLLAVDYEIKLTTRAPTAHRTLSYRIQSTETIEIGDLPPHPGLTWLKTSNGSLVDIDKNRFNTTTIYFMVHAPGPKAPPAIPVIIGETELLITPPPFEAAKTQVPDGATRMIVFWNGKRTPPRTLRVGQTIDIEILVLVKQAEGQSPYIAKPNFVFPDVRWHRFSNRRSNGQFHSDSIFFPFEGKIYSESSAEFEGAAYHVRRYKVRATASRNGKVDCIIYATLGYSRAYRNVIEQATINLQSLPEPPRGPFKNTGLVGDWQFSGSIEPAEIQNEEPFTLHIDIEGTGEPSRLEDLDFSQTGFRSIASSLEVSEEATFDRWRARFSQTLLPNQQVRSFPAINLGSFDVEKDSWINHAVTERQRIGGETRTTESFIPSMTSGPQIKQPVLLNLPIGIFVLFGCAPFLPFLTAGLHRFFTRGDPEQNLRRKKWRALLPHIARSTQPEETTQLIDEQALPLLRAHLNLPAGASAGDVARALEADHPEAAKLLDQHAAAAFSNQTSPDAKQWAKHLPSLLSILLLISAIFLVPASAPAATLAEANAQFASGQFSEAITAYQTLIEEQPGHPALHLNLAKACYAADQLNHARASCHTALLLQPRDREAQRIMNQILRDQGHPALPGGRILSLRPDQLFVIAAVLWFIGFLFLSLRAFFPLPRWPASIPLLLAPLLIAYGLWRNTHDYAPDQYMVLAAELPREPEAGVPSYEFPPLKQGDIVRAMAATQSDTHIRVETPTTSFWLPREQLKHVW